jgi:hypothetical protein
LAVKAIFYFKIKNLATLVHVLRFMVPNILLIFKGFLRFSPVRNWRKQPVFSMILHRKYRIFTLQFKMLPTLFRKWILKRLTFYEVFTNFMPCFLGANFNFDKTKESRDETLVLAYARRYGARDVDVAGCGLRR